MERSKLFKNLNFIEVVTSGKYTAKEKKILSDIEEAVEQVNLHKKGKKKLKTIQEVLGEL